MHARAEPPATPLGTPQPPPQPSATVLALSGPIAPADVAGLCECARALLERSDADLVVCDVAALVDPDAAAVDALARLRLTARRLGRSFRLRHASGQLQDLLVLMGLGDVLLGPGSGLQPRWQAEQREQACGVEEEADPGDPTA